MEPERLRVNGDDKPDKVGVTVQDGIIGLENRLISVEQKLKNIGSRMENMEANLASLSYLENKISKMLNSFKEAILAKLDENPIPNGGFNSPNINQNSKEEFNKKEASVGVSSSPVSARGIIKSKDLMARPVKNHVKVLEESLRNFSVEEELILDYIFNVEGSRE